MKEFKQFVNTACILVPLLLLTGCSTLYWKQRAKDSADIFTFELQTQSYGTSLRAGPVKLGLHHKAREGKGMGLRGGEIGQFDDDEFALFLLGSDRLFDLKKEAKTAKDNATADSGIPDSGMKEAIVASYKDKIPSSLTLRHKDVKARSPFGTAVPFQKADPLFKESKKKNRYVAIHHFTGLEATVGLFFGLKLGFNIGELFDWGMGWFGVDPFSDDLPVDLDTLPDELPVKAPDTTPQQ